MTKPTSANTRPFKKLTPKNWRTRDSASRPFVRKRNGKETPLSLDAWAEMVLRRSLSENVPIEVRNLFEVAQGAMCYGFYFYPLLTLGAEQLYRVMEAALSHRWEALDGPSKAKTFKKRLDWMLENGHLTEARYQQWEAGRALRNMASHPERQSIYAPTDALSSLDLTIEFIEELFASAICPNVGPA